MGNFTKEFEILLNHLGWGDSNPKILTIGIEEAGIWCLKVKDKENEDLKSICGLKKDNESDIDYVRRCIKEKFSEPVIPVSSEDSNVFPIAHPIAKIACGISKTCERNNINWREYRDSVLWTKGSQIANINIYPLGKKSLQSDFPSCYKELFGNFSSNEYKKRVKEDRFNTIRSFIENSNTEVIICYGKSNWEEFKNLLEIKTTERLNNFLEIDNNRKVIFTRHFSKGFSDKLVEKIIDILENWEVKIN